MMCAQGPERLRAVMNSKMNLKGRLDKILQNPVEGDFWQVFRLLLLSPILTTGQQLKGG